MRFLVLLGILAVAAGSADVAVEDARGPATATTGDRIRLDVTVANHGPEIAPTVAATTAVKGAGATIASVDATRDATCTISATAKSARCAVRSLAAGVSFHVTATVVPAAAGELQTTFSVGTATSDPDTSNQVARVTTQVVEHDAPTNVRVLGSAFDAPFQTRSALAVRWAADDAGSGVASFDVRTRIARPSGPWQTSLWQNATTEKRVTLAGRAGSTYCFSARARDRDGNVSAWSAERCTAILLPATAARRSGAWKLGARHGLAPPTLSTRQRGARLTLAGVEARRLALSVTRCPGCGTVVVKWRGRTLRTFPLAAPSRASHLYILPALGGLGRSERGSLEVEVSSSRATVTVRAFGVSRV